MHENNMNEKDINERLATLEANDKQKWFDISEIRDDIKDIKDNLLNRPSWSVSIVITMLSTICVWLLVFVVTH